MPSLTRILTYLISAVLIVFGLIFMISANLGIVYFFIGLALIALAVLILVLTRPRKTVEIKQTLTLSGTPTIKEVKCPNCGAMVDPTKPEIINGRPYVTCRYCGNKFELTEEPRW